jgi:hypothetical protein
MSGGNAVEVPPHQQSADNIQEKSAMLAGASALDQLQPRDTNPIVTLEPIGAKSMTGKRRTTGPAPLSYFTLLDKAAIQKDRDDEMKAALTRQMRTKEFKVTGAPRDSNEYQVPVLARTNPKSEMNQRFISIESPTDRRVKIASMSKRLHLNAPAIETLRREGNHQLLAQALDKKYDFSTFDLFIRLTFHSRSFGGAACNYDHSGDQ